MTFKLTLK